ncbi:MAG: threonylcarbamoyl-AMP synthase [Erysipelotrichia bacterium]|nr:threonylcarbamoyl-AMP synthase [Erysipelotrichia bacterium]NCC54161.1 threonylcarbamoyl-AMP synthase [Erysipelotrichia bacterium]
MKTIRYSKQALNEVSQAIIDGKVIAFPTDTVYGLGVRYDDESALNRLKQAKIRPDSKPIPMMVADVSQIEEVAYVNDNARRLIKHFMPGAFTIVLKKKENIPSYVSNGLATIAIRMPDDEFVLAMIKRLNKAMLVSSANLSNEQSCTNTEEVLAQLDGRIDGVVMGESKSSLASTIVDATKENVKILREGLINQAMIDEILEERK